MLIKYYYLLYFVNHSIVFAATNSNLIMCNNSVRSFQVTELQFPFLNAALHERKDWTFQCKVL